MKKRIFTLLTVLALIVLCIMPALATGDDGMLPPDAIFDTPADSATDGEIIDFDAKPDDLAMPEDGSEVLDDSYISQIEGETLYRNVIDGAGLLSDTETADLSQKLETLKTELEFDIAVVTTTFTEGKTAEQYANDYYDYGGFGYGPDKVGALVVIDMGTRDSALYINITEDMIFEQSDIDYVLESMNSYLRDGDYAGAFDAYAEAVEIVITSQVITVFDFIIPSLIVGLIAALCVTLPMVFSLKSVKAQSGARNYQREGSFKLTLSTERFLYRNITKHKKDPPKSSGGGGTRSASATIGRSGSMKF